MTSINRALTYTRLPQECSPSTPLRITSGEIEFTDVIMRYRKTLFPALTEVSVKIPAGMKVALVGRSGAGKSSIFQALLQLYPTLGIITIDGTEVSKISTHSLRR